MIDLHTHSSASDGTDTPAELVGVGAAAGVTVLAITDHDTTAGWDEALAARPPGMTIVPGTEFSCRYIPEEEDGGSACTCSATCSIPTMRGCARSGRGCGKPGCTEPARWSTT